MDVDITPDLHRFNTGISGHLGADMVLGNGKIFIEIGGNYGLIDMQKGSNNGKIRPEQHLSIWVISVVFELTVMMRKSTAPALPYA